MVEVMENREKIITREGFQAILKEMAKAKKVRPD